MIWDIESSGKDSSSLDIVVCLRNSAHVFSDFIESIYKNISGKHWVNLIFVDNASRKKDLEYYREKIAEKSKTFDKVKNIDFFELDKNYLYTHANNYGILKGSGEYVLILNPDVEVCSPGFDDELMSKYKEFSAGVMGFMLVKRSGLIEHAGVFVHSGDHRGKNEPCDGRYEEAEECRWVTGASLFFSRAKYNEVGGFDDQGFPHFGSDRDFCYRMTSAGHSVLYYPMKFVHLFGGSTAPYIIDDLPDYLKDGEGNPSKKIWQP
jgi:GT2 family glycosyltransferase